MVLNFIFRILMLYVIVKTTSYGVYCVREKYILGGISVFVLVLGIVAANIVILLNSGR